MRVETTFCIPAELGKLELEESLREELINLTSFITYIYTRFHGAKDEKCYLSSVAMQKRSPRYKLILDILQENGFINYRSHYRPQFGNQESFTRFFLMGRKFIKAIRNKDFLTFRRWITLRKRKTSTAQKKDRIAERMEESKFLDALCQHVENSLAEYQIENPDFAGYVPKKKGSDLNQSRDAIIRGIHNLQNGRFNVGRSAKVGKITHGLQQIPAQFRRGKLRGEKTQELDLASSHIFLMLENGFLNANENEKRQFEALLSSPAGFWNAFKESVGFASSMEREKFKQLFFKAVSGGLIAKLNPDVRRLRAILNIRFSGLIRHIENLQKESGKSIQAILQTLEAKLVDGFVEECRKKNIPVIPVFDSVIVRESDCAFAISYFGENRIKIKN